MSQIARLKTDPRVYQLDDYRNSERNCSEQISEPPYYLHNYRCSRRARWGILGAGRDGMHAVRCTQHAVKLLDRLDRCDLSD